MLSVNKYSLLKPDYIKSKGYKRNNLLKADEYKGHKLTRGWYNHLPLGNLTYEDKFNSDTYKLLNKGKDDRSWSKRNSNKLTLGAGAIAGGIVAGSLAAPIAVPVGLAAGGAALIGHSVGKYLKDNKEKDQDIQKKMIDLKEKIKRQSDYKGHKLSTFRNPYAMSSITGSNRISLDPDDKKLKNLTLGSVGTSIAGLATANPIALNTGIIGGRLSSVTLRNRLDRKSQMDIIDMIEKTKKHAKWNPFSKKTEKAVKTAGKLAGVTALGATSAAAGQGALNTINWYDTVDGANSINKYKDLLNKGHLLTSKMTINGSTGPAVNVNMLGPKAAMAVSGAGAALAANAPWLIPTLAGTAAVGGGVALYKHLKKKHDKKMIESGKKLPEGQYFYDSKVMKTKKQSNTGLILGSTLGALSGGLGGHILDKKIDSKGNFFNRNKAAIGGTVLGAFGGGIVGNRMDKHFDRSVSSAKSTFRDQVNFTQDDLARGIMTGSLDNPSINNSFDKLNGGLRKDLLNNLKKSRKEYKLNLQNLALGTAATGLGAGITASAIKDSMNKRTKSQSDIVRYGTIVFADGTSCKGWAVTKMHGMMDSVAKGLGQAANKWSKLPKSAKGAIIGAGAGAVVGGAKKGVKGALMGAAGGAALGGAAGYAANTQGAKNFMNKVKDHKFNAFVADKMKATN